MADSEVIDFEKVPNRGALTKFLQKIGQEVTEERKEGDPKMISKLEKLARILYQYALGYKKKDENGNETQDKPSLAAIQIIYERLEGKAGVVGGDPAGSTVADKVSEQGRKRINALTGAAGK